MLVCDMLPHASLLSQFGNSVCRESAIEPPKCLQVNRVARDETLEAANCTLPTSVSTPSLYFKGGIKAQFKNKLRAMSGYTACRRRPSCIWETFAIRISSVYHLRVENTSIPVIGENTSTLKTHSHTLFLYFYCILVKLYYWFDIDQKQKYKSLHLSTKKLRDLHKGTRGRVVKRKVNEIIHSDPFLYVPYLSAKNWDMTY